MTNSITVMNSNLESEAMQVNTMAINFEVLKRDLPVGTKIKAWTRLGNSVHGGGFYGWLEGVVTKRELRGKGNIYYRIDDERDVPVWDITDAEIVGDAEANQPRSPRSQ